MIALLGHQVDAFKGVEEFLMHKRNSGQSLKNAVSRTQTIHG